MISKIQGSFFPQNIQFLSQYLEIKQTQLHLYGLTHWNLSILPVTKICTKALQRFICVIVGVLYVARFSTPRSRTSRWARYRRVRHFWEKIFLTVFCLVIFDSMQHHVSINLRCALHRLQSQTLQGGQDHQLSQSPQWWALSRIPPTESDSEECQDTAELELEL